VPLLFGLTMFVSATLLFLVQPMVGKMILPLVGGTPAVWNSCMVFFQALLLAGYYYAHKSTVAFPPRKQVVVHAVVLGLALAAMAAGVALSTNSSPVPVAKSLAPQGSDMPFFGVIVLLTVAIGLPFFAVSTTAPLLQKWFSETGHPSAKDPYFLYAASNVGSLLALVSYPFVVEPNLRLIYQAWMWAVGFAVLAVMIGVCAQAVSAAPPPKPVGTPSKKFPAPADEPAPHWTTKLRWIVLAAVPSSLMLGVTTSITTDMVSMPLLWIIPLALYLITFIIVFSKTTPAWVHTGAVLVTPVAILLLVFLKTSQNIVNLEVHSNAKLQMGLMFATVFLITLTCHGELARTRPAAKHLTSFYLIMSFGGMLGGTFNALVAPIAFTYVSEYPLALVAACLAMPRLSSVVKDQADDSDRGELLRALTYALVFFAVGKLLTGGFTWIYRQVDSVIGATGIVMEARTVTSLLVFGVPTLVTYLFVDRPLRFGLCVGAFWLATFVTYWRSPDDHTDGFRPYQTRSFFGTIRVDAGQWDGREDPDYNPNKYFKYLLHGSTIHGKQYRYPGTLMPATEGWFRSVGLGYLADMDLPAPDREPLSYYHRTGPVGELFKWFDGKERANTAVACIGLGTGSLSSYGHPGQRMTFFEIDWTVRRLVEEPKHFTYIHAAKRDGVDVEFLMGDARLTLEQAADRKWGFMLVDAFSSDAIPAHLLTEESVRLFFDRVEADGIVALHISNRYLELEPVVERIVTKLGLEARVMRDSVNQSEEFYTGKSSSHWVAVARSKEALGRLLDVERTAEAVARVWQPLSESSDLIRATPAAAVPAFVDAGLVWKPLNHDDKVGLWTDDYTPIWRVLNRNYLPFAD
jgi:hypothetical protein